MMVKEWYLESQSIKIPYYQYTNDDFEFSTLWGNKSTDYSTKVLLPVMQQLLTVSNAPNRSGMKILDVETDSFSSLQSLEDICVEWGGEYSGVKLVNTCPLDNIITILSIHLKTILTSFELASTSVSEDLETIITMIKSKSFNQLRCWFAPRLSIKLVNSRYDFIGYEGCVTKLLEDLHLCSKFYQIEFQCWSCCCVSDRRIDISSIYNFTEGCQSSIDTQISSAYHCLKCRDASANIQHISHAFIRIPPILIFEVGHLDAKQHIHPNQIDDILSLKHKNCCLQYSVIGYTIHAGLHFNMRINYGGIWYSYDGMENPKIVKTSKCSDITLGRINCVLYVLTYTIPN